MNIRVGVSAFALAIVSLLVLAATPAAAQLLKTVKDRGTLNCGVSEGLYGFSARDNNGTWSGFDVDLCRAVAETIFNDASKDNYVPLDATKRFEALQSGSIDVLSRITTWTMSREPHRGPRFPAPNYFTVHESVLRR